MQAHPDTFAALPLREKLECSLFPMLLIAFLVFLSGLQDVA
jgi:hypothetical protein